MSAPDRHEFQIEADTVPDVLLRILGAFAVQGAELASVRHEQSGPQAWTLLEVTGLAAERVELLRLRLEQMPFVRGVRARRRLALAAASK